MRYGVVGVCILIAAVAVSIFLLSENDEAPSGEGQVIVRDGKSQPGMSANERQEAEVGGDDARRDLESSRFTEDLQPTFVEGGRPVRVVDGQTGEPVPGAVVTYFHGRPMHTPQARMSFGDRGYAGYVQDAAERFGRKFRCDSRGETRVPRGGESALVIVEEETRYGLAFFRWSWADLLVVRLRDARVGRIQTIGVDGAPMPGIPVVVTESGSSGVARMNWWRGITTGSDATVSVRDLHVFRDQIDPSDAHHPHTVGVTLGIPAKSPPFVTLTEDRFPAETIRLQVPPLGSVVVDVTGPTDRALSLRLYEATDGNPFQSPGVVRRMSRDGRAVFERVGLGQQLKLEISDPSEVFATRSMTFTGPRGVGEEVTVSAELDQRSVSVVGRVVDVDGQPVANRVLAVLERPRSPVDWRIFRLLTSDGKGRFRLVLPDAIAGQESSGVLALGVDDSTSGSRPALEGEVPVAGTFDRGENDIGDVVLKEVPIAVTGRVSDELDRPIPDATVRVSLLRGTRRRSMQRPRANGTTTDAEGRFVIRASAAPRARLTVLARSDGHLPPRGDRTSLRSDGMTSGQEGSAVAKVGDRDVSIRLVRAGGIAGSVLLDPGVSPHAVTVEIANGRMALPDARGRPVSQRAVRDRRNVLLDADATFAIRQLRPDTYALRFHGRDTTGKKELVAIEGVEVVGGETNLDPRLQRLNLKGLLRPFHQFHVTVRDQDGNPLARASVRATQGSVGDLGSGITGDDGTVVVQNPNPSQRTTVHKAGFQQVQLELKPGANEITLSRGYLLHVAVTHPVVKSARDPTRSGILVEVSPETGPVGRRNVHLSRVRQSPTSWAGTFRYSSPGRYQLKLSAQKYVPLPAGSGARGGTFKRLPIREPQVIHFQPGEFEQTVEISVTQEELDKALTKTGK